LQQPGHDPAHDGDWAGRLAAWPCTAGALAAFPLVVGGRSLPLADFVADCARSLRAAQPQRQRDGGTGGEGSAGADEAGADEAGAALAALRGAFLGAGLPALRAAAAPSGWIQVGLAFPPDRHALVHQRLAGVARELLAVPEVHNLFFMHKPPGLRLRVETAGTARGPLGEELHQRLRGWQAEGVVARVLPGVYEAEAHLFGGPVSMRSVHRLFTADSLVWLGYHTAAGSTAGPAAWPLSLVMLRSLFDALGVAGWEDRDVWDRVRWQTFRRLSGQALSADAFPQAATAMRRAWSRPSRLLEQLTPELRQLLAEHDEAVRAEVPRWRADYFDTRDAEVGAREAAAYYTVFHWNRASLPLARQALLAEALSRPPAGPEGPADR